MSDYIPARDAEFDEWLRNFKNYVTANHAALGLTLAESDEFDALHRDWETDYTDHNAAQANAASTARKKTETRDTTEQAARNLAARFQANPDVTNEQKEALNITVAKETKTPSPVPTTPPIGKVDNRNRLKHIINFFDSENPNSRAKPKGVMGCEIWMKVDGTAPTDPKELDYLATDTRTPYEVTFDGEDAGKIAHYMLRWVNTRGETGPWSETVSYTISS